MRKTIALCITLVLIFSTLTFASAETVSPSKTELLSTTKWVSVPGGTVLTFHNDGSMMYGSYQGTWTMAGNSIAVNYKASRYSYSRDLDMTEEDGMVILTIRTSGNQNAEKFYPEEQVEAAKAKIANKIGSMVSTDIINVTVKKAALAYYATGASTSTSSGKTTNITEACEPASSGLYTSSKGRCLLCIDFVIENTDRGTIDTSKSTVMFRVNQNGKTAPVKSYDPNSKDGGYATLDLYHMPIAIDNGDFKTNNTINKLIDPGQKVEIKYVGVVGFEPDLGAPFEVIASIMNSDGVREDFLYTVN